MNIDIVKIEMAKENKSIYGIKKAASPTDLIPVLREFIGKR